MDLKIENNLTNENESDTIYNVRYVWVVLYKDQDHNQTGPDYEVDRVFDCESKISNYAQSYTPSYWQKYFKVVKARIY